MLALIDKLPVTGYHPPPGKDKMRLTFLTLGLMVIVASATTLKATMVQNPLVYANGRSHEFARGDNGDPSGWRECAEMEATPSAVGIVCEGTRSIEFHIGQYMDVNYFCEFRFDRLDPNWARVDYVLCQ